MAPETRMFDDSSSTAFRSAVDARSGDRSFKMIFVIDRILDDLAGTEGQVMKLVRGLSQRMQVELVVLQDSPWVREEARRSAFPITVIGMQGGIGKMRFWSGFLRLVRHLRQSGAKVVHTFFPISNIVGAVAARLAGVRTVVGSRRDYGHWITPNYLRFTRLANRWVDRIVTNSPEVKRFTSAREGYRDDHIEVIYNGVDLAGLRLPQPDLALKDSLGIPRHHRVIGLVANFKPIKRQDSLVEAFDLLCGDKEDLTLLFIGDSDDPFLAVVEALIDAKGLRERVKFARAHGDIGRYLSIIDVGCNCSDSEGLSNAVMEYMAVGVPCVVSNGGGNKDLVRHDQNGLVYPVGDHRALASHLRTILDDPVARQRYVQASQVFLEAEMSMPVILSKFDRFYRHIAG